MGGLVLFVVIINLPAGSGVQKSPNDAGGAVGLDSGLQYQVNQNRNIVTNPAPTGETSADANNLTDQLAQTLSQNILQANGSVTSNGTSTIRLPSSDYMSNALDASMNQGLQFPIFTDKDIRVGKDNSVGAQLAYINNLGKVTDNNFSGFKVSVTDMLDNFFKQNNSAPLAKYVDIAGNQVNGLLALEVPEQMKVWHIQNLNLWEKKLVVYRAILNFDSDPLKAVLAAKEVDNVITETNDLQKVLGDYFNSFAKS